MKVPLLPNHLVAREPEARAQGLLDGERRKRVTKLSRGCGIKIGRRLGNGHRSRIAYSYDFVGVRVPHDIQTRDGPAEDFPDAAPIETSDMLQTPVLFFLGSKISGSDARA